jgi:hypothetical protein
MLCRVYCAGYRIFLLLSLARALLILQLLQLLLGKAVQLPAEVGDGAFAELLVFVVVAAARLAC